MKIYNYMSTFYDVSHMHIFIRFIIFMFLYFFFPLKKKISKIFVKTQYIQDANVLQFNQSDNNDGMIYKQI